MKSRIAMWAGAGFLVAGFWAIFSLIMRPPALTSSDPLWTLIDFTCSIALLRSHPISVYTTLVANAATYGFFGLLVESVRLKLHPAR